MNVFFRVVDFEQRLLALDEDIQAFKKKEVMNMDEMRNNVGNLRQISDRLEAALMELEVRVLMWWRKIQHQISPPSFQKKN